MLYLKCKVSFNGQPVHFYQRNPSDPKRCVGISRRVPVKWSSHHNQFTTIIAYIVIVELHIVGLKQITMRHRIISNMASRNTHV